MPCGINHYAPPSAHNGLSIVDASASHTRQQRASYTAKNVAKTLKIAPVDKDLYKASKLALKSKEVLYPAQELFANGFCTAIIPLSSDLNTPAVIYCDRVNRTSLIEQAISPEVKDYFQALAELLK